ncbi:MAG: hypothetical protein Q8P18_25700 [Pseudomonadota bacterium]|nr:hypothetical protein [Pseudomonadota bacterium]
MAEREPPEDADDRAGADKAGERSTSDRPSPDRPSPDRGGRFRRLGRRIMGENEGGDREGRTILGDAKEVFGAVLEGGDKAKTEVVRAVAREVRNYLEELGLKDDLHNLMTNYSLELHASVNLRKLAEADKVPREDRAPAEKGRKDE